MARDAELQKRIDGLEAEARDIQRVMNTGPWEDRPARRAQLARVNRRLAMLIEDERQNITIPAPRRRAL